MNLKKSFKSLTVFELVLWLVSCAGVLLSSLIGDFSVLSLAAPIIGVTALIFIAKGDVLGQLLTLIFSVLYAVVSFRLRYYGEMITYLGMTAPMAALSAVAWLKNPFERGKSEVRIARLSKTEKIAAPLLAGLVTFVFYFILKALGNASLAVSTVSVTTSFMASYLTYCRSCYYALAYAANDIVLIVLWSVASFSDLSYLSMVICFLMFFINDVYGFINWRRLYKRQNAE
ncbi:MAG: nicotinamide mononucleotide transporter [Clostridia bacterium]|nr:nicotinamide mononucleotide transporter [Clostridia bacterium]